MASADIEIKTEPLDEDSVVIKQEELIIKPEFPDEVSPDQLPKSNFMVSIPHNSIIPKEEPIEDEPLNSTTPASTDYILPHLEPLLEEQQTESPTTLFQCDTCQRNYTSAKELADHRRLRCRNHTNCDICGQLFRTNLILQKHMQKHKNQAKYFAKQTKQLCALLRPLSKKSPMKSTTRPNNTKFVCNVCEMTFTSTGALMQHNRLHNKKKHFCRNCGKSFRFNCDLEKHQQGNRCMTAAIKDVMKIAKKEEKQKSKRGRKKKEAVNQIDPEEKMQQIIKIEKPDNQQTNNNIIVKKEDETTFIYHIPPDTIITKIEPEEPQQRIPSPSPMDYDGLILSELLDRKAKSIAKNKTPPAKENKEIEPAVKEKILESVEFEQEITPIRLEPKKRRRKQILSFGLPLNSVPTTRKPIVLGSLSSIEAINFMPAEKKKPLILESYRSADVKSSKPAVKKEIPENEDFEQKIKPNCLYLKKPNPTLKFENPLKHSETCKSVEDSNSADEIKQRLLLQTTFQQIDDFEKSLESNETFQEKNEVIQYLREEYCKVKKIQMEEIAIDDSSQQSSSVATSSQDTDVPVSVFFSLYDTSQTFNDALRQLEKPYRYAWTCPECPRRYFQRYAFIKHLMSTHYGNNNSLSNMLFELRAELYYPSKNVEDNYCHLCHVTLTGPDSSRKHREEFHKDDYIRKVQFKCDKCEKYCSSRSALAEHVQANCGREPQHGCDVCGKKFHTKSTMVMHKTMHTGVLPHECSFCNKRFRTRGQLTVHTRTHTGERPFPCKVCDRRFGHRETLIAHLSRHIDMKRYKCYGCQMFFSCISGLKTHRLTRISTCGKVKLNARPVGPRVRVIKGNVMFEPQPKINPYQRQDDSDENENENQNAQTKVQLTNSLYVGDSISLKTES